MNSSSQNHLIYAFPRGEGEEVQMAIREYENKHYLDVRVWFQSSESEGYKPTRKGICLDLKDVGQLTKGVQQLSQAASRFMKQARS